MEGKPETIGRLFRAALLLLPPAVREEDGKEMAWLFDRLWRDAPGPMARTRFGLRAFGRLLGVAALEWMEYLGLIRTPGPGPNPGRSAMSPWSTNLRLALRSLGKAPAFTWTVVVLLGLGVGAVTTIFTVVDHVILRALPYPSPDRLILVENGSHPGIVFKDLETAIRGVEVWGATMDFDANLMGESGPVKIQEARVSRDFFSLFGARPALGRLLLEEDFAAADVAVLSHGSWTGMFGADPAILGRTLRVDGAAVTVVGVLGEDFVAPEGMAGRAGGADLWLPLDWTDEVLSRISYHVLQVAGRMAPGVTVADVGVELERLAQDLARRYPEDRVDREGQVYQLPAASFQEVSTRRVRGGLELLLGAVAALLLVACLNVAHLFLARGLGRVRDMAVRRALGAGTGSLVRQLLVESLVLGSLGGILGVGLAFLGLRAFLALNPTALPWGTDISLDPRILAFAAAVSGATVLFFGLLPALRSMGRDLTNDLKGTSRGATSGRGTLRIRSGLVVMEVALSLVLVAGAGLLLKSFLRLQAGDPGLDPRGVWTVPLNPTGLDDPAQYVEAMGRVEAALAALPGVASATHGLALPFEFTGGGRCCWSSGDVTVEGGARDDFRVWMHPVTESYFETLGITLLAGSAWSEAEAGDDTWPVVITEGLAAELFGSAERAVSRTFAIGEDDTDVRVVGVAQDTKHYGLDLETPLSVYLPMSKLPFPIPLAHMAVRVQGGAPAGLARMLREAVWSEAPELPVPTIRSMEDWIERSTSGRRFDSALFGAFGVLALILAAAGLYGTLLYNVGQRRRDVGIRMALGAARRSVEGEVVRQGLILAVLGCGLGLAGAWGGGRFLQSRLFDLQATDPATLAGAVAVLLAAAAVASWLPARRAARVDPVEVLREE